MGGVWLVVEIGNAPRAGAWIETLLRWSERKPTGGRVDFNYILYAVVLVCFFPGRDLPLPVTGRGSDDFAITFPLSIGTMETFSRFPSEDATRSRVESLMSSAWFSIREIADFFVCSLFASSSWLNPADSRASRILMPILNCSYPSSYP